MHFQPAVFQRTIQKDPTLLVPLLQNPVPRLSFLLPRSWLDEGDWILFLKSHIFKVCLCTRVINSAVGQMHHKNQPYSIRLYEAAARGNEPWMHQHKCTFIPRRTHVLADCETFTCVSVCAPGRSQPTLQTGGGDDSGSVVKYTWPAWCPAAVWWVVNLSTDWHTSFSVSRLSYTAS